MLKGAIIKRRVIGEIKQNQLIIRLDYIIRKYCEKLREIVVRK